MAHFAQLDNSNTVLRVVVIDTEVLLDTDGRESEPLGIAYCQHLFGPDTRWRQTSYSHSFRGHFAAVGGQYDPLTDTFTPRPEEIPQPLHEPHQPKEPQ